MSFNEQELVKIQKATSGFFKKSARVAVAHALLDMRGKVDHAKQLSEDERKAALEELMNEATAARHEALQAGASSHSDPQWAAAAACESWLHELVGGNPAGVARVAAIIDELAKGG